MNHPKLVQTSSKKLQDMYISKVQTGDPAIVNSLILGEQENKITISAVRQLRQYLYGSGKSRRSIIFYDFQSATIEAQNALLKVLEDLGDKHRFTIFVDNVESILPTIRSRSQIEILSEESPVSDVAVSYIQKLEAYKKDEITNLMLEFTSKEELDNFFVSLIYFLHLKIQDKESWAIKPIKKALSIRHLLKSNNLNPQLAFDQWLLYIMTTF